MESLQLNANTFHETKTQASGEPLEKAATKDSNVNPNVWGPDVWATMHRLALKSDLDTNPKAFSAFLGTLTELLPCTVCRTDYNTYLKSYGAPELGHAFAWTHTLHNWVNRKLGKPLMDLEKARTTWSHGSCENGCAEVPKQVFDINGVPIKSVEQVSNSFTIGTVTLATLLFCIVFLFLIKLIKYFL